MSAARIVGPGNVSGNAPQLGVPHALFQANAIRRQTSPLDVTGDGKRFLVNTGDLKRGQRSSDGSYSTGQLS